MNYSLSNCLFTLLLGLLTLAQSAEAYTRVQFLGFNRVMVTLTEQSQLQPESSDAEALFKLMNVPVQNNSMAGQGKSIVNSDRSFNLVCGEKTVTGPMCILILNASPNLSVNVGKAEVQYLLRGTAAEKMAALWNTNGQLRFVSTDKRFSIDILPDEFMIQANGN